MLAAIFIGLSFLLTLLSFHINMYIRDYTEKDTADKDTSTSTC